ncbi:T9SS type A sorting domain-containing protein, partial [bacterium]|nr:T9SS type A sorting domain-containing protein [bacterium]
PLKSAVHSRIGPVTKHLLSVDEKYSELIPGEQIDLAFSPLKPTEGYQRDFILVSTGYYVKGKGYTTLPKDITDHLIPTSFSLSQNYPNPFNPITRFTYTVPQQSPVKIEIFNIMGQRVRVLVDEKVAAGSHVVTWNGQSDARMETASGIYFCRFQAGDFCQIRKLVLLK